MVEYGHGVGEGAGQAGGVGGGSGGGGLAGGGDWGGQLARAAGDAVDTVARLPAEQLLLLVVAVIVGFWILRRAF